MTKRDAIEAMARAMTKRNGLGAHWLEFESIAEAGYEAIAEMARAELQARCSVTGKPLTVRQQFESECG